MKPIPDRFSLAATTYLKNALDSVIKSIDSVKSKWGNAFFNNLDAVS